MSMEVLRVLNLRVTTEEQKGDRVMGVVSVSASHFSFGPVEALEEDQSCRTHCDRGLGTCTGTEEPGGKPQQQVGAGRSPHMCGYAIALASWNVDPRQHQEAQSRILTMSLVSSCARDSSSGFRIVNKLMSGTWRFSEAKGGPCLVPWLEVSMRHQVGKPRRADRSCASMPAKMARLLSTSILCVRRP